MNEETKHRLGYFVSEKPVPEGQDNENALMACVIDDLRGCGDYLEGNAGDYEVAHLEDWLRRLERAQDYLHSELDRGAKEEAEEDNDEADQEHPRRTD